MSSQHGEQDDTVTLILLLAGGGGLGIVSIGTFLRPVREWMVDHHVLVTGDAVLVPFGDGIGLDIWRVAVVVGVLVAVVAIGVAIFRRRRDADV